MRRCYLCGKEEGDVEFVARAARCRTCNRDYMRAYYLANRDRLVEEHRKYRLKNLERGRQYDRFRYAVDTDRREQAKRRVVLARLENPQQRKAWDRAYYERNKERFREAEQRRRAWKLGAGRIEKIDRNYIVARDKSTCHICGKTVPEKQIELDHLVPLSRGGSHTHDNIRVAHSSCNRSRNADRAPAQLLLVG